MSNLEIRALFYKISGSEKYMPLEKRKKRGKSLLEKKN
jgi:hypothetical protein